MKYLNFNIILITLIASLHVGCNKNNLDSIEHLEGYWEIESVILSNGNQKDYTFSDTIDYIFVNSDSLYGFRKKLKPNFNGTYETSNHAENFVIKIKNDSLHMHYQTPFDQWKESVLQLNNNKLQIINQNKIIYNYKRFQPINLN